MKTLLALLLVAACGASQQQLADTPTAKTRPVATEPPPASTSDRDRDGLKRTFDDENNSRNAYREAAQAKVAPPPGTGSGSGSAAPVKKGPAEEAPRQ